MKTTAKTMTKWLLSLVFALVVISLLILPQLLRVESQAETYERNTSWSYSASTLHITSPGDLLQFVYLINEGTSTFSGKTIYLDCDIDLNPGWSAEVTLSGATGTGLSASTGTITLPDAPDTAWTNTMKSKNSGSADQPYLFQGTFDGQGHSISGIYYKRTPDVGVVCKNCGLLFNRMGDGGNLKNLSVLNSIFIWSENVGNSEVGVGGLVGGLAGSANMSNVYSEVNVVLQSKNHPRATIGGIIGWKGGSGKMEDCAYRGTMVTTDGNGSDTYPSSNANHVIGGVAGECEGGTIEDCIGIVTFAVKEPFVGIGATNQNSNSGGAHQAVAGHYDSSYGTKTRVYAGAQSSAPASSWAYYAPFGTYLPAGMERIGNTGAGLFENNVAIGDYDTTRRGSSYLITSKADYNTMITKVNNDASRGQYMTFKLTNDIDFGGSPKVTGSGTEADPMVLPTTEGNNLSVINIFKGELDGQGHVMKNISARRPVSNSNVFTGCLFGTVRGGAVRNLAIVDSYFCGDRSGFNTGAVGTVGFAVIAGRGDVATFENIFIDAEVWIITNNISSFGVIAAGTTDDMTASNIAITGRFASCNTSGVLNQVSDSASGLIVAYSFSTDNVINCSNIYFSGTRNTFVDEDNSNLSLCVHHNRQNASLSGYTSTSTKSGSSNTAKWEAKEPTSGLGSTYKYLRSIGRYVPATIYSTFRTALDSSYTLPMFAQLGTTNDRVRFIAKISKCMAQNATEVGFRITRGDGKKATVRLVNVYKSVRVDGAVQTASAIPGKGDYIIAVSLYNVPLNNKLTIEPYVIVGGSTYYGSSGTYTRTE